MSIPHRLALIGVVTSALLACGDEPPPQQVIACAATRDCPAGQFCSCTGVCVTPNPCVDDNDCCVNEVCLDGLCLDRLQCERDDECAGGRVCQGCSCVPRTCQTPGDCPSGQTCEGASCLDAVLPPCPAFCGPGTVCSPILEACVPTPASCRNLACGPGETILIADVADQLGPACVTSPTCECSGARDVPPGHVGTEFSAVSLAGTRFAVLAFDHHYGDLVHFEMNGDTRVGEPVYVDGVPAEEAPRGNPEGRRGGILTEGPRRGADPSAALAPDGTLAVAYQDVDQGVLRFARQLGPGAWDVSAVDPETESGRDPDLVALDDGRWAIAYFARSGNTSALRVAASLVSGPSVPGDWERIVIDSAPSEVTPLEDIPDGVGHFPSALFADGRLYVAYYASADGQLRLANGAPRGPYEVETLDVTTTRSEIEGAGDGGLYPDLARAPDGTLALAWIDRISGRALFVTLGSDPETGATIPATEPEEVAPGRRASPPALLGGEMDLAFAGTGRPFVLYQDPTEADLWLAFRGAEGWQQSPLSRGGAAGFSPHLFLDVDVQPWVLYGVFKELQEGGIDEELVASPIPDF